MKVDKGALIVLDGIDGVGKSTQMQLLAAYLKSVGYDVVTGHQPTHGTAGERIREKYSEDRIVSLDAAEELCQLFEMDRQEHLVKEILPALDSKKVFILDRYVSSTMAYQGVSIASFCAPLDGTKESRNTIWDHACTLKRRAEETSPEPVVELILDAPVVTALSRVRTSRLSIVKLFERAEYLEEVRRVFLRIEGMNVVQVDTTRPVENTFGQIRCVVEPVLEVMAKDGKVTRGNIK